MRTDGLLNAATIAATALATVVAAFRLAEYRRAQTHLNDPAPTIVSNWFEFVAGRTAVGPRRAPVTVSVFFDFLCPYCHDTADDLRAIRLEFPQDVRVVYRHYAISRPAREAARAAFCADRFGRFPEMLEILFNISDSLARHSWPVIARAAGIGDTSTFASCLADPAIAAELTRDSTAAARLEVRAVPTLLINRYRFTGSLGLARLRYHITRALRESQ